MLPKLLFFDGRLLTNQRDWPDSNRRPSASDWCEFPHSLDYSFTLDVMSLGGGRYVVGIIYANAFIPL